MLKQQSTGIDVDDVTASIYRTARQLPPDEYIEWCFDQLSKVFATQTIMWCIAVPSDAICSGDELSAGDYRIERCGYRSSQALTELREELAQIDHLHPLIATILSDQTKAHSFDIFSDSGLKDDTGLNGSLVAQNFIRLSRKYDVPKTLGIALPCARTNNMSVLTLWRRQLDSAFSAEEIGCLEQIGPHITQGLQHSLTFTISSRMLEFWDKHNAVMTLSKSGLLVDIDERFEKILDQKWPGSSVNNLHSELEKLLDPNSTQSLRKDNFLFSHYLIEKHHLIVATELGELANLTQRELEISILFANGEDNKTIASIISRSSSTVRNHLRNIYHKLGIKSRSELVGRLQRLTSMPQ